MGINAKDKILKGECYWDKEKERERERGSKRERKRERTESPSEFNMTEQIHASSPRMENVTRQNDQETLIFWPTDTDEIPETFHNYPSRVSYFRVILAC